MTYLLDGSRFAGGKLAEHMKGNLSRMKINSTNYKKLIPWHWRKIVSSSRYKRCLARLYPVDLIVHVGAHWGQEADQYEDYGARTVLWIEADPDTYSVLTERLAARRGAVTHLAENALVSAGSRQTMPFYRFSNMGASSSVYRATDKLHEKFPDVMETGEKLSLSTCSLPDILARNNIDPSSAGRSMLVLDVQGHEYEVLKGLGDGLRAFQLCTCEVSRIQIYEGGARYEQVDAHMEAHGFRLVSQKIRNVPDHGDVLYRRM